MRTLLKSSGELELSLVDDPVQPPAAGQVVVEVGAAPINPSDLGLLLGPADVSTARVTGSAERPTVTFTVPERFMKAMAARADQSLPVGNEGAGVVVAAGEGAEALLGKKVAVLTRTTFAQYTTARVQDCLVLPDDSTAAEGASCFVNPLTALGFVDTMRMEGHSAIVHTAAASNLGQMLNRICLADGVPLVNVVRREEQAALLREQGAAFVCVSEAPDFIESLTAALTETGATLAFDAIGGGRQGGQILAAMEVAANRRSPSEYSRYGSDTFKQLYIYGGLDTRPTELNRNFGFSWSIGGWLLMPFMLKAGGQRMDALRQRVADELRTTFASRYTGELTLAEALNPERIIAYNRKATGEKYLITPNKGLG
jgi:NADPH:quinone reductase-like Zn-dependent oxidoreductase